MSLEKIKKTSEDYNLDIFSTCLHILEGKISLSLSAKAKEGLKEYVNVILSLRKLIEDKSSLHNLLEKLVQETRYFDHLKEDPETAAEKKENVLELVSKAAEWEVEAQNPTLTAFLEELTLKGSADEAESGSDKLSLMTLHHAKGLEFKIVFLVGMEEELFPHMNSSDTPEGLEEERRLCYVGITRAMEHLYLSASRMRFLWGGVRMMRPSRFLSEIPEDLLKPYHITSRRSETSEESEGFNVGDLVLHKDFGEGKVLKAYNTSLGITYDVYFAKANATRSLVAKYAKLEAVY